MGIHNVWHSTSIQPLCFCGNSSWVDVPSRGWNCQLAVSDTQPIPDFTGCCRGCEPVSDINTALVDRLKALDPNRPIREADICSKRKTASRRSLRNLLSHFFATSSQREHPSTTKNQSAAYEIDPALDRHEVDNEAVLRRERFNVSSAVPVRFSERVLCALGREQDARFGKCDPSPLVRWQCRQGAGKRGLGCSVELLGIRRSGNVCPK